MNQNIQIKEVLNSRDLMKFIKFPWSLYKNDPYWVPPLISDVKNKLDPRKNPFHEHAEVQTFLAYENKKIVGRIAAIIDNNHNEFHKEKVVFFGFFDVIENQTITNLLLNTVKNWGKTRGMTQLRGPANLSSNDEWGTLVKGFDSAPVVMMTYNPEFHIKLYENYGLKKLKDLVAYHLNIQEPIPARIQKAGELIKKRYNVTIRPINMKKFDEEVALIQDLYNKAWYYNWGFVPMTPNEIIHLAHELKPVAVPELILIAEVNGEPAGFSMTLPDYNQALKHANGRLFPFGLFKLLYYSKKITTARLLTLGIIEKFRKKGIEALFYLESWKEGKRRGYIDGEMSWVLEDNAAMRNGIEKLGVELYKTYRIYNQEI